MPRNFTASHEEDQDTTGPRLSIPSSRASSLLRTTGYIILFVPALFILNSLTTPAKSTIDTSTFSSPAAGQNAQYLASVIRENLPAYLDFVGSEVLPAMSKNVDDILHNLNGLTDIRSGLFYHGHIDYSIYVAGGIDGLIEMRNVVLQYHTLENPLIFIPYWKEELGNIQEQDIDAWLERSNEYNKAIETPSMASQVQYTPLTEYDAANIASSWDAHRRQNGLASPGPEMLINMVYLIDGSRQPLYQDAFKNLYRFHSIAFGPEGYLQLDNRTHLENTFSPFQITFERIGECQELLPVFEEARAAAFVYILNWNNVYVAQNPTLLQDPKMAKLSKRLNDAITSLPDDNMIKISNTPGDQQIAFFAVGSYVFAVHGSLDSPSIFK